MAYFYFRSRNTAECTTGCIDVAEDKGWSPDYILGAHAQPGGPVSEAARTEITDECLRRLKILSPAKVIVLSSLTHPASPKAVEARLVGADAVIGKPSGSVSKDVDASGGGLLIDTINRLLSPLPAGATA